MSPTPRQQQGLTMQKLSDSALRRLARIAAGQPLDDERGAVLTAATRNALKSSDFAIPDTREYPIHDLAHARNALSRAAQNETGARLAQVRNAVFKRYPALRKNAD